MHQDDFNLVFSHWLGGVFACVVVCGFGAGNFREVEGEQELQHGAIGASRAVDPNACSSRASLVSEMRVSQAGDLWVFGGFVTRSATANALSLSRRGLQPCVSAHETHSDRWG